MGRGFFEDEGGFFDLPTPKNEEPPSTTFGVVRTKNPPSATFSARSTKNPPLSSSSDPEPLDQWPPAPFSYADIWIFSPIFLLEDRSEDRIINRSSTEHFFPLSLHRNSLVRASQETSRTGVSEALERTRDGCPGRTDLSASRLARPGLASPPLSSL